MTNHPTPPDLSDLPLFARRGVAAQTAVDKLLKAPPVVPSCDRDTSLEAAHHQARSGRATSDERRVYEALVASADGLTDDQVEILLAMRHQTASARRRGLVLKGLVEDSGRRRKTSSGRLAIVWVCRDAGSP